MLTSIQSALAETGKSNAAISRAVGRSPQTIWNWFSGHVEIPHRMRKNLCDAIGAEIDWPAYEVEFAAIAASRPEKAPAPPRPSIVPPAPQMPAAPPQRPATAPRRLTATPPAKRPQRPSAPAPIEPARSRGILGFLFDPSDDGAKFA